jgi:hypothetical protein
MPGLPKSIIKKHGITKKAWSVYRATLRKYRRKGKTRARNTRRASNPKKVKRRMVRRKKRRGGKNLQATVFKWLRIGSIFAPEIARALNKKSGAEIAYNFVYEKTGYNMDDGTFEFGRLLKGWGPFIATSLVTYGIPKLIGIIRRL